ncbi:MAG: phenylalanine--tRNA ligase subunit beta [Bryobacteraceae bacterium]|nr:phenylalanine--tRNA ligase subunit beta [Bryobacteraceae bacterium]
MKFSYEWLRELVPGLTGTPEEVTALITMKTAECEGVEPFAPWLARVCAARVLAVTPVEGSHNVCARVDAGPEHGEKQVVCGAPNCRAGLVTAYVPAGVALADKEIRKAVIGGVESDGMLASGAELGLNREADGILELPADIAPGATIATPDAIIEVDNKSLTHRPDLWGHHGLAREVAAFSGLVLKDPVDVTLLPAPGHEWSVEIEDYAAAPRYSALVFENVTVGPSPAWLQARLEALDMNPISNIVDVTNLIMAELAQPMHAFDMDKLHGHKILVRRAKEGESFDALNGESYTLAPRHIVIADAQGAIALGGVIGGAGSAISGETKRIVLESANFDAATIRKTSSELKLRTDASMRFEKAQDPVNTTRALARAITLFEEVSPSIRLVGGLIDAWQPPAPREPIRLPLDWLANKLGLAVPPERVRAILESLAFHVEEPEPGVFAVQVPSWRATKDVTIKDDLLEEIGRIIGYAEVPLEAPQQPVRRPWVNHERLYHHEVRAMAAAQGFTEVSNYSFVSEEMAHRFGMEPSDHLRVANPISIEQGLMRVSLLPGMHRNLVENAKRFEEFRLFEIGNEIHKRIGALPDEVPHFMAALYRKQGDGSAALLELKRLAECLLPGITARPAEALGYEHPARSAVLEWRGELLGRLYELHPMLVEAGRAAVLDLDLRKAHEMGPAPKRYQPLRRFPSSAFDLSVVAGLRVLAGDVSERIRAATGACCDAVDYLYSYRGQPMRDDQQSLSFRITVSAADHTLTNDELTLIRNGVMDALRAQGFELRA